MAMEEVRVHVPTERLGEFHRFFGDWLDGRLGVAPPAPSDPKEAELVDQRGAAELLGAATDWWRSLRRMEAAVWSAWVDAAPKTLTAQQLVDKLGFKSARDIPGALSWSGRKGEKYGFPVGWHFDYDSDESPIYGLRAVAGMTVEEYADLLRQARSAVESEKVQA